jgi:hypothetical protein
MTTKMLMIWVIAVSLHAATPLLFGGYDYAEEARR